MRRVDATLESILEAAKKIRTGGIVIYPTDTVYGLGCDPFNVNAVAKLIKVKGDRRKPLPILCQSIPDVKRIAHFTEEAQRLADAFWPGPLTLVLKRKPVVPDIITTGLDTVGVRIPRHEVALKLIGHSGGCLIGTSANISGQKSPITAEEITQIGSQVDIIIDAGATPLKKESTVIDLTAKTPRFLRIGPVSAEAIANILGIKINKDAVI
ncbi:threonylcarbamoyl-AMP synthase [Candidatus Bathyarchaeota archaeon]|nr:threonylcarbamoyl-AMP synthase [Candidatus Bathyarchaeota archaeon]